MRPLPRESPTDLRGVMADRDGHLYQELREFRIPGRAPELVVDRPPGASRSAWDTDPHVEFHSVQLAETDYAVDCAFGSFAGEIILPGDSHCKTIASDSFREFTILFTPELYEDQFHLSS